MPKQFGRKIDISSPAFICIVYPIAALIVILIFRLIFPDFSLYDDELSAGSMLGSDSPVLSVFRIKNSLTRGILDFISFFPALFISAQLMPFRRAPHQKNAQFTRFSPEFFKLLRPQLIIAVAASIVYSLLFLLIRPLAADYQVDIRTTSMLFTEAKEKTAFYAYRDDWTEASRFLAFCENIWPGDPELDGLREYIGSALTRIMYSRGPTPSRNLILNVPGEPVDAQTALNLTETALKEERFYDAHRLAVIAGRLSKEGSNEAARANRLAGAAWNAIESLEPDADERERYAIYQRKRDGYEAINSGDWVHAYYIFRGLMSDIPDDPDVKKFFAVSAEGLGGAAFFIDEMDEQLGAELSSPFFSLPLFETQGRLVMRLASLSSNADYSYGKGLEIAAFDSNANPLYRVSAPYVKFLPVYIGDEQFTVIYLQAWGRDSEDIRWGPSWEGTPPPDVPNTQIMLAIDYEDFLSASIAGRNLDGFFIRDIWSLASRLGSYGYIPEVYQAEIIYIISESLLFLPMIIFSLTIGWNLRGKKHSSSMLLPMFIALPIVLSRLINVLREVVNMAGIFTLLSLGFTAALLLSFATAFLLFVLGLVLLASQSS
ncbi:MAG: hypothetical protein LBC27_07760 [Spirochaetaceae bacterium]|nr:hypothetical protein [Spirochaetaceae bacterium]